MQGHRALQKGCSLLNIICYLIVKPRAFYLLMSFISNLIV